MKIFGFARLSLAVALTAGLLVSAAQAISPGGSSNQPQGNYNVQPGYQPSYGQWRPQYPAYPPHYQQQYQQYSKKRPGGYYPGLQYGSRDAFRNLTPGDLPSRFRAKVLAEAKPV